MWINNIIYIIIIYVFDFIKIKRFILWSRLVSCLPLPKPIIRFDITYQRHTIKLSLSIIVFPCDRFMLETPVEHMNHLGIRMINSVYVDGLLSPTYTLD